MVSLRLAARSGIAWTGTASAFVTALQFVQIAVLARLLEPTDFGLMALVLLVTGFAQSFMDMGVNNAIIHRRNPTAEQLTSLYWLNIASGILLFGVIVLSAPLVSAYFEEPQLATLIGLTGLVFLIAPLGQQFQVLLQKNLRFLALGIIDSLTGVVSAVVSIGSAYAGQGVFSLVWGILAGVTFSTTLLLIIGFREWRPGLRFRKADLAGYLSFGIYQVGDRVANYTGSRIDQLLIGSILGTQALGYYSLAFNLAMLPYSKLSPVLTKVGLPVLARVQDDCERLKHGFLTMQKVIASVNFPILFGLAAVAPAFVIVVYGEQWSPVIGLVQILAFVSALRSVGNPTGSLLLAKGRADKSFHWTVLFLATQAPAIYVAALYGETIGIAATLLTMQVLYYFLNYLMNIRPLIGPCLMQHLGSIAPPGIAAGGMAIGIIGLSAFAPQPSWPSLLSYIVTGIIVYIALGWFVFRNHFRQIAGLLQGRQA